MNDGYTIKNPIHFPGEPGGPFIGVRNIYLGIYYSMRIILYYNVLLSRFMHLHTAVSCVCWKHVVLRCDIRANHWVIITGISTFTGC